MLIDIYTTKIILTNANLKNDIIPFDSELKGKHVKVKYTHGSIENGQYKPRFLCFDKDGKALPMYMVGCKDAIEWIKIVDNKLNKLGYIK